MKYPQIAIIIPAFNEAENIVLVIEKCQHWGLVIVVDNGSTDNTYSLAKNTGAIVIKENRKGYGNAVFTGMLEAKQHSKDILVVLDADLSDDPNQMDQLIHPILQNKADFCLSVRKPVHPDALQAHQKWGNLLATKLIHLKLNYHYQDLGPFRAIRSDALWNMHMEDVNFGWNIEMQVKAIKHNLRIMEIPLPYYRRNAGISKISGQWKASVKAGIIIVRSIWKYA